MAADLPTEYQLTAKAEKTFSDLQVSINRLTAAVEKQNSVLEKSGEHAFGQAAAADNDSLRISSPEIARTMDAMQEWIKLQQTEAAKNEAEVKTEFDTDVIEDQLGVVVKNTNESNVILKDILAELKKEKDKGSGELAAGIVGGIVAEMLPALAAGLASIASSVALAVGGALASYLLFHNLGGNIPKDESKIPGADPRVKEYWDQAMKNNAHAVADRVPDGEEHGMGKQQLKMDSTGRMIPVSSDIDREFALKETDLQQSRVITPLESMDKTLKSIDDRLNPDKQHRFGVTPGLDLTGNATKMNTAPGPIQPSPATTGKAAIDLTNRVGPSDAQNPPRGAPGHNRTDTQPGPSTPDDPRGVIPIIRADAIKYGIDPDLAVRVFTNEGIRNYTGDKGTSFGATQLHIGGGLGDQWQKQNPGKDIRDPANEPSMIDFSLKEIANPQGKGWEPYHGSRQVVGKNYRQGIGTPGLTSTPPPTTSSTGTTPTGQSVVAAIQGLPTVQSHADLHNACALTVNQALTKAGLPPITDARGNVSNIATDASAWGIAGSKDDIQPGDVVTTMYGNQRGQLGGHTMIATGNTRIGPDGKRQIEVTSSHRYGGGAGTEWRNADDIDYVRRDPGIAKELAAAKTTNEAAANKAPTSLNLGGPTTGKPTDAPVGPQSFKPQVPMKGNDLLNASTPKKPSTPGNVPANNSVPATSAQSASALNSSQGQPATGRVGETMAAADLLETLFNLKYSNQHVG
jgi:hypothetical protein